MRKPSASRWSRGSVAAAMASGSGAEAVELDHLEAARGERFVDAGDELERIGRMCGEHGERIGLLEAGDSGIDVERVRRHPIQLVPFEGAGDGGAGAGPQGEGGYH